MDNALYVPERNHRRRLLRSLDGLVSIEVEARPFVRRLVCPDCGKSRKLLRLSGRLNGSRRVCGCGADMVAPGFDLVERLDEAGLTDRVLALSLRGLGLCTGDVLTDQSGSRETHLEI